MGDNQPKTSLLTNKQREALKNGLGSNSKARMTRKRIRDRVRDGLGDFQILADHLDKEDLEKIFDVKPQTDESRDLDHDVMKAIEFLYVGMRGESGFRKPLKFGVANGEVKLRNTEYALNVAPRFTVDTVPMRDTRKATEAIEAKEWDRIYPPDLFAFISLALRCNAIDFETIYERIERDEQLPSAREINESGVLNQRNK